MGSLKDKIDFEDYRREGVKRALPLVGIIGLGICILILIALIPFTIVSAVFIVPADIPHKSLFVSTLIFLAIVAFLLILAGMLVSASFIRRKFNKPLLIGVIVTVIIAICLGIAAITTGTIWTLRAGPGIVGDTWNALFHHVDPFLDNIDINQLIEEYQNQ